MGSAFETRVARFERESRVRRGIELVAAVLLALAFTEYASWFESAEMRYTAIVVVATVLAATVTLMLLTKSSAPKSGTEIERADAWRAILRTQARVYAWSPIWLVLPVLLAVVAFVIALDRAVYGSRAPSAMLPADIGIMIALGLGAVVLLLEWSRKLRSLADTLTDPEPSTPAAPPPAVAPSPAQA